MILPDYTYEQTLLSKGFSIVGGIDEVGRGCWAGPVVASCVVIPSAMLTHELLLQVRDSKTLNKKKRQLLSEFLKQETGWGIGEATSQEIDSIGIGKATHLAMERAIQHCTIQPVAVLIDGNEQIPSHLHQQSIIDGDALCYSIAAASIIAKVYRDKLMEQIDNDYPGYGFAQHVGYGTKVHQLALTKLGPSPVHRYSFKPVATLNNRGAVV